MGWGNCGWNEQHGVWMGYAHEGVCMEPECAAEIHHGLSYVCGNMHEGGELGCGGYFCEKHLHYAWLDDDTVLEGGEQLCSRCCAAVTPTPEDRADSAGWVTEP